MLDPFKVPKPSARDVEEEARRKKEFEQEKEKFERRVKEYLQEQHEEKPAYYPRVPHRQRHDGFRSFD